MTHLLSKLFSRGNRSSDRIYSDRARPDRDAKTLARENRVLSAAEHAQVQTKKK